MTYNNLGCLYKKVGSHVKALKYLMRALDYKMDLLDYGDVAGTHLNICAIKAEMGMHEDALEHATSALNLLKDNFQPSHNIVTTLIIAYHNVGVQYEILRNKPQALIHYQHGMELALEQLGRNHPLTRELASTHLSALDLIKRNAGQNSSEISPAAKSKPPPRPNRRIQPEQHSIMNIIREKPRIRQSERPRKEKKTHRRFLSGEKLQPLFNFKQQESSKSSQKSQTFSEHVRRAPIPQLPPPINLNRKRNYLDHSFKEPNTFDSLGKRYPISRNNQLVELIRKFVKLCLIDALKIVKNRRYNAIRNIQRAFRRFVKMNRFSIQKMDSIQI